MKRLRKLTKKLLAKSQIAFLLSLELYSKPTIEYRTEAFSIFFTNAWELLLKARIFEINLGKRNSIFYEKKRNYKRQTLTLDACLNKVFTNVTDPIKKNIEYISDIRNESCHLVLEDLDSYFSRVFQSGVLNYLEYLKKWFDISLEEKFKPGIISLVTDLKMISDINTIKRKFNKENYSTLVKYIEKFNELETLGLSAAIPVSYRVVLTKNKSNADIILSSGANGQNAVIIEKFKDIDKSHPFRRKEAITEINNILSYSIEFNSYSFDAYCHVKGIKNNSPNDFYWKPNFGTGQYSKKLIEDIAISLKTNPKIIEKVRKQYKGYLKAKRKL